MSLLPRLNAYVSRTLIAALPLALIACGKQEAPQDTPPPAVSYIEVGTQEVGTYAEFVARTEAFKHVDLRARVEGNITQRLFVEGETVEKDQLLFEIDRDQYEAAHEEALANLKSAEAEQVRTARDYKRGLELRPNGFISQSDLDTLASNAAKARAAEKGAKAALQNAKLNLSYTHIKAPFAGEISRVRYNVGNLVGPSSEPLATLLQDDPIYANFSIDETTYISHLQAFSDSHVGERVISKPEANRIIVSLQLPNGRLHDYKGEINYASNEVDPSTGTVTLRAQFPNPTGLVRPGLYSTLVAESVEKESRPVVPQYAVQESQQGRFVLVINEENQVKSRTIEPGRRIGTLWVVESGLVAGDRLIVEGLQKVRIGSTVNPVRKYLNTKTGTLLNEAQHQQQLDNESTGDAVLPVE